MYVQMLVDFDMSIISPEVFGLKIFLLVSFYAFLTQISAMDS